MQTDDDENNIEDEDVPSLSPSPTQHSVTRLTDFNPALTIEKTFV